jgi:hypothetical protein
MRRPQPLRVHGTTTELTYPGGPRVRILLPPAASRLRTGRRPASILNRLAPGLSNGPKPERDPVRRGERQAREPHAFAEVKALTRGLSRRGCAGRTT